MHQVQRIVSNIATIDAMLNFTKKTCTPTQPTPKINFGIVATYVGDGIFLI